MNDITIKNLSKHPHRLGDKPPEVIINGVTMPNLTHLNLRMNANQFPELSLDMHASQVDVQVQGCLVELVVTMFHSGKKFKIIGKVEDFVESE